MEVETESGYSLLDLNNDMIIAIARSCMWHVSGPMVRTCKTMLKLFTQNDVLLMIFNDFKESWLTDQSHDLANVKLPKWFFFALPQTLVSDMWQTDNIQNSLDAIKNYYKFDYIAQELRNIIERYYEYDTYDCDIDNFTSKSFNFFILGGTILQRNMFGSFEHSPTVITTEKELSVFDYHTNSLYNNRKISLIFYTRKNDLQHLIEYERTAQCQRGLSFTLILESPHVISTKINDIFVTPANLLTVMNEIFIVNITKHFIHQTSPSHIHMIQSTFKLHYINHVEPRDSNIFKGIKSLHIHNCNLCKHNHEEIQYRDKGKNIRRKRTMNPISQNNLATDSLLHGVAEFNSFNDNIIDFCDMMNKYNEIFGHKEFYYVFNDEDIKNWVAKPYRTANNDKFIF